VLEVVRTLVIEWKTAIGIVSLLGGAGLDAQEWIDKTGPTSLLIGRKEKSVPNCAVGAGSGREVNDGRVRTGGE